MLKFYNSLINILFLIIFIFLSEYSYSKDLFDTEFYEISFTSNNIENDKVNFISDLKIKSFENILEKTLIKSDFKIIEKRLNNDFVNLFVKNIIIEDEKIINDYYYSKIKINFIKKNIINYFRKNKFPYVEFLPKEMLTIIYENNKIYRNLFSENNLYYKYLLNNKSDNTFFRLPNLDVNDRYILTFQDIENKNINKLNNFSKKYSFKYTILIIVKQEQDTPIYEVYLLENNNLKKINIDQNKYNDLKDLFLNIKYQVVNQWKIKNKIQNNQINKINCSIKFFNLNELKYTKKILKEISIIEKIILKNISYNINNYDVYFYGDRNTLFQLFELNNLILKINNNSCNIYLK